MSAAVTAAPRVSEGLARNLFSGIDVDKDQAWKWNFILKTFVLETRRHELEGKPLSLDFR